ncbi:hypothetical protein Fot_42602 [Forsythia ovata]|uniref:Uncharacterized protein n=1 Tax=Forsythia ovata TaxID=205694 RepID=A0ABD1RLP2_9LAMI
MAVEGRESSDTHWCRHLEWLKRWYIGALLPRLDRSDGCYGSRHRCVKGSGTAVVGKRKRCHCFGHFHRTLMEEMTANMELSFLSRRHNSGRRFSLFLSGEGTFGGRYLALITTMAVMRVVATA